MRNCKQLTDETIRTCKGRSKQLRKEIKELEAIEDRNILEQYCLCGKYQTLTWIPFADKQDIFELCKTCEEKPDSDEVFKAMHSGEFGEIIWGKVYPKRAQTCFGETE